MIKIICKKIGCSGVDKDCPGNPKCSILINFVGKEFLSKISDQKNIDPKISKLINDNFWDLF